MTLGELLGELIDGSALSGSKLPISGITADSREVADGYVFLAMQGVSSHGVRHLDDALARGAACVLIDQFALDELGSNGVTGKTVPVIEIADLARHAGELAARFYGEPAAALPVFGVTGTNGKTSVAAYIAQLLHAAGMPCGLMGTLGAGLWPSLTATGHTTLDAVSNQRWLAQLRDEQAGAVAMEVSSHALDQHRVAGIPFAAAIMTNLSRDHLDYHGSEAAYKAAKARLFEVVSAQARVVNLDDAWGQELAARFETDATRVTYALRNPEADYHCIAIQPVAQGYDLRVHTPTGVVAVQVPLLGEFNLSNLLAALAAIQAVIPKFKLLADHVAALKPAPGRMQRVTHGRGPAVVVDYAHTPDALQRVLAFLKPHSRGLLWCVFGCGGDRDRGKRPQMAAAAEQWADRIVLTDDNPRTESGDAIMADIQQGFSEQGFSRIQPEVIRDRATAISQTVKAAQADDWVLIAGKGHETYQEVAGQRLPCDDVALAKTALNTYWGEAA